MLVKKGGRVLPDKSPRVSIEAIRCRGYRRSLKPVNDCSCQGTKAISDSEVISVQEF